MRRLAPVLVSLLGLSLAIGAQAQSWSVRAQLGDGPGAWIGVHEVPRDGGEVDGFALLAADPAVGLTARWSDALGPLGTVVVEGDAELRLGEPAAARAAAGVRGVLGPVAARLRIAIDGAPAERFASGAAAEAPYARGVSLRVAADGRASRVWLLSGAATAWRDASGALTYDLDAAARARSVFGREGDARLALETRLGAAPPRLAIGLGAVHVPRRAPELSATAWLDLAPAAGPTGRAWLGLEAAGAWRFGQDRVEAALLARPGGRARTPWSLDLSWRRSTDEGEITLQALGRAGGPDAASLQLRLGFEAPLDRVAR
jgi:hypothetical protein